MSKGKQQGNVRGQLNPTPDHLIERDVDRFAAAMKAKLRDKAHYGYWEGIDPKFYLDRLIGELEELEEAWAHSPADCAAECVDVANMAMMLFVNVQRGHEPAPVSSDVEPEAG